ncbi:MAG TPA: hypothetical protein VFA46_13650 [Actinomycetes bacterium]|jgi:hypothetical protein|nr:hypothetical protein [Actinomycetes bacterium]
MSAVAAELAATVALRPAHRVACQGCGWIGYRRKPWCRDCPACGVDASKVRPEWLAGCAPRRGRCCYLGHIEDAGIPARVIDELMGHAGGRGGGGEQERRGSLIGLRYRWTTPEMEARVVAAITQRLAVAFTVAACTAAGDRAAKPTE